MTLVITAVTDFGIAQASDRRLTKSGKVHAEDYNKSFSISTPYGQFIVGFTGLAEFAGFSLIPFLLNSIEKLDCNSVSDPLALVETIRQMLDDKFNKSPSIRRLPRSDRHTEVVLTGYFYGQDSPVIYKISNWENGLVPFYAMKPDFINWPNGRIGFLSIVGTMVAVTEERLNNLSIRLGRVKSIKAARDVIAAMLTEIGRDGRSKGMIGGHTDWLYIDPYSDKRLNGGNFTGLLSDTIYLPGSVMLSHKGNIHTHEMRLSYTDNVTGEKSVFVPAVKRNQLCPCGRGKRYKNCHKTSRLLGINVCNPHDA